MVINVDGKHKAVNTEHILFTKGIEDGGVAIYFINGHTLHLDGVETRTLFRWWFRAKNAGKHKSFPDTL